MMMGTPSYMAPEQVVGGKITAATDVFAMGSVLYELLTGARPFEGNTLHNTLYKIVSEEPPPVRDVMPGLPSAVDRVFRRALAKEPASRYQNALEMADDLAAVRAELDSEKRTTSTLSLRRSMETAIAARAHVRAKRRRYAVVAAVVLVVGAAAAGGVWVGTGDRGTDGSTDVALAQQESASGDAITPAALTDTLAAGADSATPEPAADVRDSVIVSPPVRPERPPATTASRSTARAPVRQAPPTVIRTPPTETLPTPRQAIARTDTVAPPESTRAGPPAAPAQRNVVAPPPPVTREVQATEPVISDSTLIARAVQAYAQAIASRDVDAVRRVNPGLSAAQREGFQQFFQATRALEVTFSITRLSISGATADAEVKGTYEYEQTRGGERADPVGFTATLRKEDGAWRFVSVR
jgi:serine/threonine-protein kinase